MTCAFRGLESDTTMTTALFEKLETGDFEQLVYGFDRLSGLKTIIAIHNTALGPAFGGTRMFPYPSEEAALEDVLKLAEAMTYKNAAGGIDFGGGKAVIIGDPRTGKTEDLLRAFGRVIQGLGGRYITGVDVGTDEDDMVIVHQETKYNVAMPEAYGGGGSTSAATAYGLHLGMMAAAGEVFGSDSLKGRSVAIQGVGHIGGRLVRTLVEEGARVFACDVDRESLAALAAEVRFETVGPEEIYDVPAEIFSPNALGGVLNERTIPRLKCRLIAGAANNQLADEKRDAVALAARGIAYAVDYILSVGGCINNSHQFLGYRRDRAYGQIAKNIPANIKTVFRMSREMGITTAEAARLMAEQRIQSAINRRRWYLE
jgi:leucine dehydrogenase